MPEAHAARRRRAQRLIRESGADAALITAGANVRYLSGLASSNAALLLPADSDGALLATDARYTGAALRDAPTSSWSPSDSSRRSWRPRRHAAVTRGSPSRRTR